MSSKEPGHAIIMSQKQQELVTIILYEINFQKNNGNTYHPDILDFLFKNPPINFLKENKIKMIKYRDTCNQVCRDLYRLEVWNNIMRTQKH
jgi:hypothetical protein